MVSYKKNVSRVRSWLYGLPGALSDRLGRLLGDQPRRCPVYVRAEPSRRK